eukprot:c20851_g1_i1.p1 GENE.c20851_g1_i1~~c20851_g1_i1.p1  ORF type:complete len:901 (-),score=236.83 c20851_g1_i1:106-2808(-)
MSRPTLKGVVKAVPSGDTIIVMNGPWSPKTGAPQEKRISLSGILAPRLGFRKDDAATADEPFAWEAREVLRELSIGKTVSFQLEGESEDKSRSFATVFLPDGRNLAAELVQRGLVKLRFGDKFLSSTQGALEGLDQAAKLSELGLHGQTPAPIRSIVTDKDASFSAEDLIKRFRNSPVKAVVEFVFSASTFRVSTLPDSNNQSYSFMFSLSGIRCPALRSRTTNEPEPFALEAKFFTESRMLHRTVDLVLELIDAGSTNPEASKIIYGTVLVPEGNIGVGLTKNGFARLAAWSLSKSSCASELRGAESHAKQQRLRLFKDFKPQETSSFDGRVVEIAAGDTVLVAVDDTKVEERITLSSIRTKKLRGADDQPEPFAQEAKDFVRHKLIGKKVHVTIEYSRTVEAPAGKDLPAKRYKHGTITVGGKNIAELLAATGLCEVLNHRDDEPRSTHYEALLAAQAEAKTAKKGIWSPDPVKGKHTVNDLSGAPQRAKAFLNTFNQKTQTGVVDFIANGGRMKVFLPKHSCLIPFALASVRVPLCARRDGSGPASEPFGDEAFSFTRNAVMQREVQLEIENIDRGGTFLGHMWLPGTKDMLSEELLKQGLASTQSLSIGRTRYSDTLVTAEAAAKASRLGIWKDHVEPSPEEIARQQAEAAKEEEGDSSEEFMDVTVTEIRDGQTFFVRPTSAPALEPKVLEHVKGAEGASAPLLDSQKRPGQVVASKFAADGQWYRVRIDKVLPDDKAEVTYVDYGNQDTVKVQDLRGLSEALSRMPAQAYLCRLAFIKVPTPETEHGLEAAEYLASLAYNKRMVAKVEQRDKDSSLHMSLFNQDTNQSVNEAMLTKGLARVQRRLPKWLSESARAALNSSQDGAKRSHLGIWEYGDAPDSDDEKLDIGGQRIRK